MKRAAQRLTAVGLTLLLLGVLAQAQDAASAQAGNATVPRMVKFSGTATNAQGKAINGIAGITFSIYKDQQGGAALWMETQNVNLDSTGRYSVLLGATRPEGLPMELFASGEARWVGVRVNGQAESARVVLLSVPYALKANDAETLGGLPASAFLRAAPPVIAASSSSDTSSSSSGSASLPIGATPTGSGLAGDIAIWTTSSNLGNSHMAEGASGLSVNEALNLPATGAATSVSGKNSQSLNLFGASFSSTLATSISQHFRLLAEPAGNNTTTPSGTLNLQYATGTGTPAETGISFTSGGIFKAKTVNATTLSGNGASVTNVNAAKLGGFLPSAFARLGVNDNFTGSVTAASFSTGGNVSGATGSFTGNVNVGGAEAVTGNLSSGGTVSGVTGSFTGNLNVGGAASVTGNLTSGATISGV
ncbi:MAG TPA: hypothetical protein VFJ47_13270, partial [Terriglobales bacterium]|nr:hypothetical protein [Terriglobales bacterium]